MELKAFLRGIRRLFNHLSFLRVRDENCSVDFSSPYFPTDQAFQTNLKFNLRGFTYSFHPPISVAFWSFSSLIKCFSFCGLIQTWKCKLDGRKNCELFLLFLPPSCLNKQSSHDDQKWIAPPSESTRPSTKHQPEKSWKSKENRFLFPFLSDVGREPGRLLLFDRSFCHPTKHTASTVSTNGSIDVDPSSE